MDIQIAGAIVAAAAAFGVIYVLTPYLARYLTRIGSTVPDVAKKPGSMVPRPGGPAILAGLIASGISLYAFVPDPAIISITLATTVAFAVGFIDDRRVMGGWFKPVGLTAASLPILLMGTYDATLHFPLFGNVQIPVLYIGLAVIMIPITGNTINSIDVLNGVASGFMVIAGFTLSASLFIVEYLSGEPSYTVAFASLPLGFAALAFYRYHRIPSRIFPGDSGALVFGAMYGAIAIVGGVEVIAAIALLPAIVNSFLFLASVRRIVEHRQLKSRPVRITDDLRLEATDDRAAAVTLLRLILAGGPLTERQAAHAVFRLTLFSGALAIITAFMTGVRL